MDRVVEGRSGRSGMMSGGRNGLSEILRDTLILNNSTMAERGLSKLRRLHQENKNFLEAT